MTTAATGRPAPSWDRFVHAATLGADRCDRPESGVARIDAMLAQVDGPETWVRMAAALSLYSRCGAIPGEVDPALPADPGGDAPCSAVAAAALERILHDDFASLLEAWCRGAARAGQVARPEHLPELLDRIQGRPCRDFAGVIAAAVGRRGLWLASLNPRWRDALPPAAASPRPRGDEDVWTTGAIDERIALLSAVREADPARGLALVESTWKQDAHDDRAAIIAALAAGLGDGDEAFLEHALDDKRKPVRAEAARLLSMLPRSALAARMAARARAAVERVGGLLGRKLAVTPPEGHDAAMRRDGVESRKRGTLGERAAILCDIVAATPLNAWNDGDAGWWIAAASKTEWSEALLRGWCAAAARQRSTTWAAALAGSHLAGLDPNAIGAWADEAATVLPLVDPASLEKLARSQIKERGLSPARPWLDAMPRWSPPLSRVVLAEARSCFVADATRYDWPLRDWFRSEGGRRLAVEVADEAGTGWPTDHPHWNDKLADTVSHVEQTLRIRHTIDTEFAT